MVKYKMKMFLAEVKTMGHSVKELFANGLLEFNNQDVKKLLGIAGIHLKIARSYTPEQIGSAEREIRRIMKSARTRLHAKNLPEKLWAEFVYLLNRSLSTSNEVKSPSEFWARKDTSLEHFKVFGTDYFVHISKEKRRKLDKKSLKGFLVRYIGNKNGYRIWSLIK